MTGEQKYNLSKVFLICLTVISFAAIVSAHDQRMMELRTEQAE